MTFHLIAYLFLLVAPIGMIIHECGHALGAILTRATHTTVTIGSGKQIYMITFKRVTLKIHALYFLGGSTETDSTHLNVRHHIFWITLLGPLNNGLFAIIFYYLNHIFGSPYLNLLCLFNTWLAIVNIIPFKFKEKQSDGYILLHSLHNRD